MADFASAATTEYKAIRTADPVAARSASQWFQRLEIARSAAWLRSSFRCLRPAIQSGSRFRWRCDRCEPGRPRPSADRPGSPPASLPPSTTPVWRSADRHVSVASGLQRFGCPVPLSVLAADRNSAACPPAVSRRARRKEVLRVRYDCGSCRVPDGPRISVDAFAHFDPVPSKPTRA